MPAKDGSLSKGERKLLEERFHALEKAAGKGLACDMCGNTEWFINPYLLALNSDAPELPYSAAIRTPAATFICYNCGQIRFFAAMMMGLEPENFEDVNDEGVDDDKPNAR